MGPFVQDCRAVFLTSQKALWVAAWDRPFWLLIDRLSNTVPTSKVYILGVKSSHS